MSHNGNDEPKKNGDNDKEDKPEPQDNLVATQHTITLNGIAISYTVTTGTIVLKEETEKEEKAEGEKAKASMFFTAYVKNDVSDPATRPITFSFNGGPGSSSVWLHMGVLGPRRVDRHDVSDAITPPFRLVDNAYSLLDESDLVFIDPVSTGFSRAVPGEKPKQFFDFKKDIESVGDFIRLYVSRFHRWTSPKFLIGESYGTTRAAGLSGYLQERHGMYLNGIMLVSSVLNFLTLHFSAGNDLPYILFLPTYTATAWYHGRLAADLQADLATTLAEVEAFALGEYASALLQGSALPDAQRADVAQKLARYTGLTEAYLERTNLRVDIHRFCKELLREQRRTVGRLDSRYVSMDRDAAGEHFEFDPSYAAILGPYTATFNDYVRRELAFASDLPYEILNFKVFPAWQYAQHQNDFVNVAETLRSAMTTNPALRVHVANGYYDLATPYLATRYTFDHLQLDPTLQPNISMSFYEAGHMMYVHLPSLAALKENLAAFMQKTVIGGR
ncbi:MAG: peptidase S10 [Anaerolinea sp.]|nr:peptidase S10 [Anaerolinea sp.]